MVKKSPFSDRFYWFIFYWSILKKLKSSRKRTEVILKHLVSINGEDDPKYIMESTKMATVFLPNLKFMINSPNFVESDIFHFCGEVKIIENDILFIRKLKSPISISKIKNFKLIILDLFLNDIEKSNDILNRFRNTKETIIICISPEKSFLLSKFISDPVGSFHKYNHQEGKDVGHYFLKDSPLSNIHDIYFHKIENILSLNLDKYTTKIFCSFFLLSKLNFKDLVLFSMPDISEKLLNTNFEMVTEIKTK